jgi:hypothetical protein
MNDTEKIAQLEAEKAQLSLDIIELARQLAEAEMKIERAYDSGFQHGEAAGRMEIAAAGKAPKKAVYAIGYERTSGTFGMVYGPVEDLDDAKSFVPSGPRPRLIRFNPDGTEDLIGKWDPQSGWIIDEPQASAA